MPTERPTPKPTEQPSPKPTHQPTVQPQPSQKPSETPTEHPLTPKPTEMPTERPTPKTTEQPSSKPTHQPTVQPQPSQKPSETPTEHPLTPKPTEMPTERPTSKPTEQPSSKPTHQPTVQPQPSQKPSETPTEHPLTPKPTAGLTSAPATTRTPCHNDDCRRCQNVIEIIIIKANGKCALLDTLEGLLSSVDASVKAKLQVLINTLTAVIKAGKTDAEDVVLQCAYELSTILAEAKKNSAAAIKFAEIAAWGTINDLLNVAIALKASKAPSVIVLVPGNNGSTCALLEALLNVSVHVEAENQFSFKAFISKINSCVFSKKSTTAILAEIANEFNSSSPPTPGRNPFSPVAPSRTSALSRSSSTFAAR
ncbi:hypothetical protein L596_020688 [Steinernema carpocapsae]|uniref:Uncharacterized protein n=1 Tax=Steinernema carpocapsae TaxID=34508 RepID=A0A4U5MUY2_STECR|nr:hypothetical protein L596_020688 [Steinernema carpocapsae]